MSRLITGAARTHATLFPEKLDDYVSEDNATRVIDLFIDGIDLSPMGFKTIAAVTVRPGYHPETMLKLYVYGYLNGVIKPKERFVLRPPCCPLQYTQ